MDQRASFDKIALNIITYLESFPECRNVNFQCGDGAASHESLLWEKKNAPFKLPNDFKNFCSLFNGINLGWNVNIGDKNVQIGEIRVNRMDGVKRVPVEGTFAPLWDNSASLPDPKRSSAFSLDSLSETGDIVFLYREPQTSLSSAGQEGLEISNSPEIWFVDLSARWHFICKSFTQYLRASVTHLGIYGWQLCYTLEGLPDTTQHWMNLFCKERLMVDRYWRERLLCR